MTGADPAAVRAALTALGGTAADPATYAAEANAEEERLVDLFTAVLIGLSVVYTGIAIANTLLMAAVGRVRDFAVLRLSAATVRQVLRVVAAETVLVVAVGTGLGARWRSRRWSAWRAAWRRRWAST